MKDSAASLATRDTARRPALPALTVTLSCPTVGWTWKRWIPPSSQPKVRTTSISSNVSIATPMAFPRRNRKTHGFWVDSSGDKKLSGNGLEEVGRTEVGFSTQLPGCPSVGHNKRECKYHLFCILGRAHSGYRRNCFQSRAPHYARVRKIGSPSLRS